jgi:hypothetical protein
MSDLISVSPLVQRYYKEMMRKYFATPEPDGLEYIHNIVDFLMNDPKINGLKDQLGEEQLKEMLKILNNYRDVFQENLTHRRRLSDLSEDDKHSKLRKSIESKILSNCAKIPIAKITLWKIFWNLVSNTELVKISPPTASEQTERRRRPDYSTNELMGGDDLLR